MFKEMGVQYNNAIEEHLKEIANYFNANKYKLPEIEIFKDNNKNLCSATDSCDDSR